LPIASSGTAAPDLSRLTPRLVDPELRAALDHYVASAMARLAVPGAAVAVVQRGQIVYERGFGVRELGKPDTVTSRTLMMIGSTGKSMTTMMMATLVDDGKLRWDTPAQAILPSFALRDTTLTRSMTMQYLVCNCTDLARADVELLFDNRPRS